MAAPLGLRTLAGVIDDEGIEQRHVTQQRIGETVFREPDALAGQPLERAMLADVDNRIGLPDVAEPTIQAIVMMRRWQIRLMVDRVRIHAVAARRLQGNERISQLQSGQHDVLLVHVRCAGGWSPLGLHLLLQRHRQLGKPLCILLRRDPPGGLL